MVQIIRTIGIFGSVFFGLIITSSCSKEDDVPDKSKEKQQLTLKTYTDEELKDTIKSIGAYHNEGLYYLYEASESDSLFEQIETQEDINIFHGYIYQYHAEVKPEDNVDSVEVVEFLDSLNLSYGPYDLTESVSQDLHDLNLSDEFITAMDSIKELIYAGIDTATYRQEALEVLDNNLSNVTDTGEKVGFIAVVYV